MAQDTVANEKNQTCLVGLCLLLALPRVIGQFVTDHNYMAVFAIARPAAMEIVSRCQINSHFVFKNI